MIGVSEIARLAQVSKATAARVLSNNNKINVAPATKQRVLNIAKQLNYRPNRVASSFATGKTQMIGLIGYSLSDHFIGEVFTGVQEALYPLGYDFQMLLWSSAQRDTERLLQSILDRRLDGVIIAQDDENEDFRYLSELQRVGVPVVAVDREIPQTGISFVGSDDFGGAKLAVQHLIDKGHREIVFAGVKDHGRFLVSSVRRRYEGYKTTMLLNNLAPAPEWLIGRFNAREKNRAAFLEIIEKHQHIMPTAVFANNDNVASDVIVTCHRIGLRVPDDVSIVGFSDEPIAEIVTPALTTIHQDPKAIGRKSADVLLERINKSCQGQDVDMIKPVRTHLPTRLIERDSVAER